MTLTDSSTFQPSALTPTDSLVSIGGQKEDVRDVVRRLRPGGHAPALHQPG